MQKRFLQWALLAGNLVAAGLFFCLRDAVSAAGNAAMLCCLAVLAADLLYAIFAKNRLGFWLIPAQAGLLLLSYFARQSASDSFGSLHSVSTLNFIAMLAMPLLAAAFFALDLLGIGRKEIQLPAPLRFLRWLLPSVLLVGLFAFALLGYDHVYNYGYSYHEYAATRGDFLFMAVIFSITCLFLRQFIANKQDAWKEYLKRNIAVLTIFAAIAGFGFHSFSRGYLSFRNDVAAAEAEYQAMFGESSKAFPGRAVPLSIPQLFFGVRNGDYQVERDISYRTITEGDFSGLSLAYDAYYPSDSSEELPSVIIWLHGGGGDKGHRLHTCKYLASKGYAVYDLQLGEPSEKNTNFPERMRGDWEATWNLALESIDAFFAHASVHESANANFDSVFIMGASRGGGMASEYIYLHAHRYQEYGVNVRGIVPLYGIARDAEIDADSLPAFIYTGSNDGYINVWEVRHLREKYSEAGNSSAMLLEVSFAGHGVDSHFSSRGSQLQLYYLERFLGQLR